MENEKIGGGVLGNTPPTNTSEKKVINTPFKISDKVFFCIHYLKYMIPYTENNLNHVLEVLNIEIDSYVATQGFYDGMFAYLRRYGDTIIKLPSEYKDESDVFDKTSFCVELTGSACRSFENRGGHWDILISYLEMLGGECVRIDTPFDIHDKRVLDFKEFYGMLAKGFYQSSFKSMRIIGDPEFVTSLDFNKDFTLYLGRRGSDRFMRVYNKIAERIANGFDVYDDYWIRYEFSMAHEKSKVFCKQLIKNGFSQFSKIASEAILDFLDFRVPFINGVPTSDSNIGRWDRWDKWQKLLEATSKLKLINENNVETSITRQKIWFDRSMAGLILGFYLSSDTQQEFLNLMFDFMYKHLIDKKLDAVKFERVQNDRVKHNKTRLQEHDFLIKINEIASTIGKHKKYDAEVLKFYIDTLFNNGLKIKDINTERDKEEQKINELLEECKEIYFVE